MSDTQKNFAVLFGAYMVDGVKQKLFAFIDRQNATDLDECITLYFTIDVLPILRDRSRAVFARLAERLAAKSADAALVVGVLTKTTGQTWRTHYQELDSGEKSRIDKAVAKQKAALPRAQRGFVEAYMKYMSDPKLSMAQLTNLIKPMKAGDLQACVRLYLALSQAYEERAGKRSLDVFYFVSLFALKSGRSTYALEYEKGIADTASLLHARFEALGLEQDQGPKRQKSLTELIADAKAADTPKSGTRPGESKLPPLNAEQANFVKLYRAYVDEGKSAQMVAFENALRKPNGDTLAGFVAVYLEDSVRRYGEPASSRSLEIFFGTLWWALEKSSSFYAVKVKSYIDAKDSLWKRRFDALNVLQYGNRLRAKIDEKIKNKRLLDDLKVGFWLKNQRDPNRAELWAFDPINPGPDHTAIDNALGAIDVAVGARAFDSLDKAYSAVAAAIEAEPDPKARWMLVRRILERTEPSLRFRHLAYLQGVGLIYLACVQTYKTVYWSGFDQAEREFYFEISEGKKDRYFLDFAAQIDGTIGQRGGRVPKARDPAYPNWNPGKNDDAYTLLAKAEAALLLCADIMNFRLTPPLAAAALRGGVQEAWDDHRDELEAIRIKIDGRRAGKAELTVGQTIGNVYILWWDRRNYTAYVQVKGYGQVVFEVDPDRLGKIYEDYHIWGKVAEYTEGIALAIPFMFQILGYIPDLVSGGITGLVKSVLFNLAFEHSMEAMGIDPTKAQLVLLGVSLLHRGLQPKAEEPHLGSVPEPAVSPKGGGSKPVEFYGLDAGHVPVPEAPQLQFYDLQLQNPRSTPVPIEADTGLPSSQGYDPAASSPLLLDQRKTGPTYAGTENPGTAPSINGANRSTAGGVYSPQGKGGPVPYEKLDPFPYNAALTGEWEPKPRSIAYMSSGDEGFSGGMVGGGGSTPTGPDYAGPSLKKLGPGDPRPADVPALTKAEGQLIEKLRSGKNVNVYVPDLKTARKLLANMPDVSPHTGAAHFPWETAPKGTYRGDLVYIPTAEERLAMTSNEWTNAPYVHGPDSGAPIPHQLNPHYNVEFADGRGGAIIIGEPPRR